MIAEESSAWAMFHCAWEAIDCAHELMASDLDLPDELRLKILQAERDAKSLLGTASDIHLALSDVIDDFLGGGEVDA